MASGLKRIAVINDNELARRSVEQALTAAGFEVLAMGEPQREALEQADFVLIDLHLPQVFGDEAVGFLKQVWNVRGPVYLYSRTPEEELRQLAADAGADGYVCKAWGLGRLVQIVSAAVARGAE